MNAPMDPRVAADYRDVARFYRHIGWTDVIPCRPRDHVGADGKLRSAKGPLVSGKTGYSGTPVTDEDVTKWCAENWTGAALTGIRMPESFIGLDRDAYKEDGVYSWDAAVAQLGEPGATWSSTARGEDQPSRIRLYRLPAGMTLRPGVEKAFREAFGEAVDVIHRGWRHVMVWPSRHPSGGQYRFYHPDGTVAEHGTAPRPEDIPVIAQSWADFLCMPPVGTEASALFGQQADLRGGEWKGTREQAMDTIHRGLEKLAQRTQYTGNRTAIGGAARFVGRFVPELLDIGQAEQLITEAVQRQRHGDGTALHSDAWNLANGKSWTLADNIAQGINAGMGEPWVSFAEKASAATGEPATPAEIDDDLYSEAAIAQVVADECLSGTHLWTTALGWMRYNGIIWKPVDTVAVRDTVRLYTMQRHAEAVVQQIEAMRAMDNALTDKWNMAVKGWYGAQFLTRLNAIVSLASGMLLADAADFDADPELLNTPSGVVDLRTGDQQAHDRSLLMTRVTAVDYVPGKQNEAFTAALQAVPDSVQQWLQVRLGQAITGRIPDDGRFVILTGDGENGKTTLMNALFDALTPADQLNDGYSRQIVSELLLKSKDSGAGPSPAKMSLMGTRLAYFEETPEGRHLDANVVKKLMDTPKMSARKLYKDNVTFTASHSMFLNTNYVPTVSETDHGTWRRLVRVDFPYRFVSAEKLELEEGERRGDPELKARLRAPEALQAALAWMVEGAVAFHVKGTLRAFRDPAEVEQATAAWRRKSDLILDFCTGRVEWGASARGRFVDRTLLYELYREYCTAGGYGVPSMAVFLARLESHSVIKGVREARVKLADAGYSAPPVGASGPWGGTRPSADSAGRIRALTGLRYLENGL